jgi:transposase
LVFSGLSSLVLDGVDDEAGALVVRASTRPGPVGCPDCGAATGRVHGYVVRQVADVPVGGDDRLTDWIDQARAEDLPHLHAYTRGLEFDRHAVNTALTLPFHNGRTEGVNTKTKMIKRQMYGRAGFPLLHHRILPG